MSITLLTILDDGTVYPFLQQEDLVVQVFKRKIVVGRFNRSRFMTYPEANDYITEPLNAADLKADAIAYLSAAMPGLFGKQEVVYFKCPPRIAGKAEWDELPSVNTFPATGFIADTFE